MLDTPSSKPQLYERTAFVENNRIYTEKKSSLIFKWLEKPIIRCKSFFWKRDYKLGSVAAVAFSQISSLKQAQSRSEYISFIQQELAQCGVAQQAEKSLINLLFRETISAQDITDIQKLTQEKQAVDRLLKDTPKTSTLHQKIADVQKNISIFQKWKSLGQDERALKEDFESVKFLVENRIIFSIVGFQNSTKSALKDEPLLENGKLYIRQQGEFVAVSEIQNHFQYAADQQQLIHKNTGAGWNYFQTEGLVPVDRFKTNPIVPVAKLSSEEMKKLLQHANQFSSPNFKLDGPADCVLQIFTNPRKLVKTPENFLFNQIEAMSPVHVGFRLIDKNGDVYSSGFGSTVEEDKYITGLNNYCATINGMPTIMDYEEFRPHEGRIVTSVPMTAETFKTSMKQLQEMRDQGVRFNILTQNCSRMASRMLEIAGIHIDHKLNGVDVGIHLLPSVRSIPIIKTISKKIFNAYYTINSLLPILPTEQEAINSSKIVLKVVLFPIWAIANCAMNLLLLAFGAGKGSPIKSGIYTEKTNEGLRSFTHIIDSPIDILREKPHNIYHSGPIIDWQLSQNSTATYVYSQPSMNILPEPQRVGKSGTAQTIKNKHSKKFKPHKHVFKAARIRKERNEKIKRMRRLRIEKFQQRITDLFSNNRKKNGSNKKDTI